MMPFTYDPLTVVEPGTPRWCEKCDDHYELTDEESGRTVARHRDHADRALAAFRLVGKRATEAQLEREAARRRQRNWFVALVEVVLAHIEAPNGRCKCEAEKYPCFTVLTLQKVNPGIHRVVENLGALTREELDDRLYQEWSPREWDEDDLYERPEAMTAADLGPSVD
jgi:hypothetical protein